MQLSMSDQDQSGQQPKELYMATFNDIVEMGIYIRMLNALNIKYTIGGSVITVDTSSAFTCSKEFLDAVQKGKAAVDAILK